MRKTFVAAVLFSLYCTGGYAQKKIETVEIATSIYCDHCNECESCGPRLENAIYELKGIKRVEVHETDKKVKIVYRTDKTSADEIRMAISNVGFDADNIKANQTAYLKLDDCCKRN